MEAITKEQIIKRERENNGTKVHLYYNEVLGLYLGFGLSAYFTTMLLDPMASYSDTMEMPVVILKKNDILQLRQSMKIIEHKPHEYYLLQTRNKIGNKWYNTWTEALKQHIR